MRRDRADETRYGWPPVPPSYLLPAEVPWDYPICDHSPLWQSAPAAAARQILAVEQEATAEQLRR